MRASTTGRAGSAAAILTIGALLAACAQAPEEPAAPPAPTSPTTAADPTETEPMPTAQTTAVSAPATESEAPEPTTASVTPPVIDRTPSPTPAAPVPAARPQPHDEEPEPAPALESPPPSPVAPGTYTTQNGSATFTVPAGWSGTDRSWPTLDPDTGAPTWINIVDLVGPGVALTYLDTPQFGGSWSYDAELWEAVDARPVGDGDLAQSFWRVSQGRYIPHVALTYLQGPNDWGFDEGSVNSPTWYGESRSNYRFEATFEGRPSFGTEAEVVAFLRSAPAVAALDVVASVRLTGVDGFTMP